MQEKAGCILGDTDEIRQSSEANVSLRCDGCKIGGQRSSAEFVILSQVAKLFSARHGLPLPV